MSDLDCNKCRGYGQAGGGNCPACGGHGRNVDPVVYEEALTDLIESATKALPPDGRGFFTLTLLQAAEEAFLASNGWTKASDTSTARDWKGQPITLWQCPLRGELRDTNDAVGLQKARIAHGVTL